jgi:hypothetical protein
VKAWPLRVASVALGLGALALFWLAFTQFGGAPRLSGESEGRLVHEAQVSVVLGIAGCFALLGALACHSRARSASGADPPGPRP